MNIPNIRYYAKMDYATRRGYKTPLYKIISHAGYYAPMEKIKRNDGYIYMNLLENRNEGYNIPPLRLQTKKSLNFTGLKGFFENGISCGFAYGYPLSKPTYGKDKNQNPFYEYRDDGFLFIIHTDPQDPVQVTPTSIELIVLEGAKCLISAYCDSLRNGCFDDIIKDLRKQSQPFKP